MAEQILTSAYRTGEVNGEGFRNCFTLQYCFGSAVEIHGLSGKYCLADRRELEAFFLFKGIKEVRFYRLKHGEMIPHVIRVQNG